MRRATPILTASALLLGLLIGTYALRPMSSVLESVATACPAGAQAMSRLELLFGASRRNAPPVTDDEWQAFVDGEITPRFPDGLTILDGIGQWRGSDSALTKEHTRVLLVWHVATPSRQRDIETIRAAYKMRFGQESVMRVDDGTACVSF